MLDDKDIDKLKSILATKEDFNNFATKKDLNKFATKEDFENLATSVAQGFASVDKRFNNLESDIFLLLVR